MQETTNTKKTPTAGNLNLADSTISELKKDINQLRETLEMIEWSMERTNNNVKLWVDELPLKVENILKHFS